MLKTVLETLEGVDDAVQPFYAEVDGKFILQIEGVDNHPEVAALSNAYARTKADRETAKEETKTLKAQIAELQKGAPDTAATQAKLTALEERLAEAEAKAGEWQGKYVGITRDQSLTSALQSVGITEPAFIKGATALLSGMVKLGDDGSAYVETPMGPKVLSDYVKTWAAGEGKPFVTPPSGGNAKGNQGGQTAPVKPEAMGPQERAALLKDDPDAFYKAFPQAKIR